MLLIERNETIPNVKCLEKLESLEIGAPPNTRRIHTKLLINSG